MKLVPLLTAVCKVSCSAIWRFLENSENSPCCNKLRLLLMIRHFRMFLSNEFSFFIRLFFFNFLTFSFFLIHPGWLPFHFFWKNLKGEKIIWCRSTYVTSTNPIFWTFFGLFSTNFFRVFLVWPCYQNFTKNQGKL